MGVLGPLLVERGGVPVRLPRSVVVRGLLGVLLVAEGRALSTDRLLELVWAGRQDQIGRGSVYVGLSRLRRWLGLTVDPGEAVIEQDVDGYRLIVDSGAVDLSRFRMLVARRGQRPTRAIDADCCGRPWSCLAVLSSPA